MYVSRVKITEYVLIMFLYMWSGKTFARDVRIFTIISHLYTLSHSMVSWVGTSAQQVGEKKYEPLLLRDVYNIIIKPLLLVLHNIIIGVEITPYYLYIIYYMNIRHTMNRIHRGTPPPISSRARVFRATARASGPKRNLVCPCGGAYMHVWEYISMYVCRVSCVCVSVFACVWVCVFYPHRSRVKAHVRDKNRETLLR